MAANGSASSTDAPTRPNGAVALPKRDKPAVDADAAPVWSLERHESSAPPPLATVCDVHKRPDFICCRELKGDDERDLVDPAVVRDLIVGLADGLTVPFALTAGLASLGNSKLVVLGGLAELFSGAISMGIGGFLASEAEQNAYRYSLRQTRDRVRRSCSGEMEREVHAVLGPVGVDEKTSRQVAAALMRVEDELAHQPSDADAAKPEESFVRRLLVCCARRPKSLANGDAENGPNAKLRWSEDVGLTAFLLRFAEGQEPVPTSRLVTSALTIGGGYFAGGLIPLVPYFFFASAYVALWWSIGITSVVLLAFGCLKAYYTGCELGVRGYTYQAVSTLFVGGAAAGVSALIVRLLDNPLS